MRTSFLFPFGEREGWSWIFTRLVVKNWNNVDKLRNNTRPSQGTAGGNVHAARWERRKGKLKSERDMKHRKRQKRESIWINDTALIYHVWINIKYFRYLLGSKTDHLEIVMKHKIPWIYCKKKKSYSMIISGKQYYEYI